MQLIHQSTADSLLAGLPSETTVRNVSLILLGAAALSNTKIEAQAFESGQPGSHKGRSDLKVTPFDLNPDPES